MKVARWFYVKDPVFPSHDNAGRPFHHPALYKEIMSVIKENPGLTGSEIAAKLGKSKEYVVPRLWILKRYTQSVRIEKSGFVRTPGLDEFRKVPSVQRMLGKLGSEKTKGPWTRRLFRYEQWLKQRGYFNSITEALEAYKKADTEDKKYFHVNLIQEFLNSWKADKDTKDSIVTVLRGFYRKNRAELPREKIVYSKDMLLNTPSGSEDYVKPEEIWRIINDGRVPVRDKAIISVLLYMGLDESTLATQFNYYAYPQLVKALGESFADWEVSRAPIRINLIRPKTSTKYYNFLPQKGLQFLKDWLNVRKQIMGSDIKIRREAGGDVSDPIFISSKRRPIYEALVASVVRDSSFKAGVQRQTLGTKRYRIHGHEFRDTFKTTCKFAGMDGAVAEFFIGHSIDKLGYDKSPWAYPDHFREQYSLVEPYLSGEGRQYRVQEEKRRELEDRIKSLESALSRLVAEKGEQVLAMDRTRR